MKQDTISVSSILMSVVIGETYWGTTEPQPISVSVSVPGDLRAFTISDNFEDAPLDYRILYNTILKAKEGMFDSVFSFHITLAEYLYAAGIETGEIQVEMTKLCGKGPVLFISEFSYDKQSGHLAVIPKEVRVKGDVNCIIGILEAERLRRQTVSVDMKLRGWRTQKDIETWGEADTWDNMFKVSLL
jgi:dihydroneopterin aldolase